MASAPSSTSSPSVSVATDNGTVNGNNDNQMPSPPFINLAEIYDPETELKCILVTMKGPQYGGDFRDEHDSVAATVAMYVEELNTVVKIDLSLLTVQSHVKQNGFVVTYPAGLHSIISAIRTLKMATTTGTVVILETSPYTAGGTQSNKIDNQWGMVTKSKGALAPPSEYLEAVMNILSKAGLRIDGDLRPKLSKSGTGAGGYHFNFSVIAEHGQPDKTLFRRLKPREPLTTQTGVQYYMRFCQELCAKYGVCKDCHQVDMLCTCSSTRPNQFRPKRDRAANQANAAARTRANQQRIRQSS